MVRILDCHEKYHCNRVIRLVRVQWACRGIELTWELEDDRCHPHLFETSA